MEMDEKKRKKKEKKMRKKEKKRIKKLNKDRPLGKGFFGFSRQLQDY